MTHDIGTIRHRVLGEDEPPLDPYFYEARHGQDARLPLNNTALRQAERLYKQRNNDFENVIDFDNIEKHRDLVKVVGKVDQKPLYTFNDYPGFLYIPGTLCPKEQRQWIQNTFSEYLNPPNPSSLDTIYKFDDSFMGYWQHLETCTPLTYTKVNTKVTLTVNSEIEKLVRKLRWTTLGYRYDWTTKSYNFDTLSIVPFPNDLAQWSTDFAQKCGFRDSFRAEAGIVNYYQPGDSLTCHVDRSEINMDAPLLSMSFGLDAIFLLGGISRDDPVIAIRVKSGDVSILSGKSRLFFHGVPRIIEGTLPTHLESTSGALTLIQNARININIRQVT